MSQEKNPDDVGVVGSEVAVEGVVVDCLRPVAVDLGIRSLDSLSLDKVEVDSLEEVHVYLDDVVVEDASLVLQIHFVHAGGGVRVVEIRGK